MLNLSTAKKIRRKNRLDQAASDKASMLEQMKQMLGHLQLMTKLVAEMSKGENWVARTVVGMPQGERIWVGEGDPQELADKLMIKVFGPNYKKQMETKEDLSKIKVVPK